MQKPADVLLLLQCLKTAFDRHIGKFIDPKEEITKIIEAFEAFERKISALPLTPNQNLSLGIAGTCFNELRQRAEALCTAESIQELRDKLFEGLVLIADGLSATTPEEFNHLLQYIPQDNEQHGEFSIIAQIMYRYRLPYDLVIIIFTDETFRHNSFYHDRRSTDGLIDLQEKKTEQAKIDALVMTVAHPIRFAYRLVEEIEKQRDKHPENSDEYKKWHSLLPPNKQKT